MTNTVKKLWTVLVIAAARLRFVAVFAVAALVMGYWDNIKNYVDKWTRPLHAPDSLAGSAVGSIEFYCPMHPDVVRQEQGQCPKCGMPLVKRKKGEAQQLPADVLARVTITPRRIALAGIQTSPVEPRALMREIRSVALLDYDETRLARISARVGGRADELFIQFNGQAVKRGDPIYSLYSPDVFTAIRQYLLARKRVNELPTSATADTKSDASTDYNATLQKLVLWGITQAQLDQTDEAFDRTGSVPTNLTITSPIGGIVVRKEINQGQYVQVGDSPYTVADLAKLWLQLKVYERDIPLIQIGDSVEITVDAFPNESFTGTVIFKAFQLDPETRTLDARVEVENPGLRLRPGMFAGAVVRVPVVDRNVAGTQPSATQPMATTSIATQPTTVAGSMPQMSAMSPSKLSSAFRESLGSYLSAQKLLSQDKAEGVAALLQQSLVPLETIKETEGIPGGYNRLTAATKAANGQALPELRKTFQDISAAMIEIGKVVGVPADGPPARVFRCPMKKANWIQEGDATANPYYGTDMFSCGTFVEALPLTHKKPAPRARAMVASDNSRSLSVPRSAVIDTGRNKIVYVESSAGVFDMRAVKLGPLATVFSQDGVAGETEFYPVVDGLSDGDRVVTVGTFLVDAENRLNPSTTVKPTGDAAMPIPGGLSAPSADHVGHQH